MLVDIGGLRACFLLSGLRQSGCFVLEGGLLVSWEKGESVGWWSFWGLGFCGEMGWVGNCLVYLCCILLKSGFFFLSICVMC
jgi:hypothetical protein